ncbi:hypothetical protein D1007_11033 [Hordeum vulgare]|nr:hypothetical protein D1007_11033 [Hordeum vulgare]
MCRIPSEEQVEARVPRDKHVRESRASKCVVFGTHFTIGFGLAVSRFIWQFLEFYGLQMHHLGPNSGLYLARGTWSSSPFLPCSDYSCTSAHRRTRREGRDWVNLPPFADEPPTSANWDLEVCNNEVMAVVARVKQLKASLGLLPLDLVVDFISCRVLPLQEQTHWICDMDLRKDPCWLSIVELASGKIAARLNAITQFKLDMDGWWFRMEPSCHSNHVLRLFSRHLMMDGLNPQVFVPDRDDSDPEDYELDGDYSAAPRDLKVLKAEDDKVEAPSGAPADRARPCDESLPDVTLKYWNDDNDDDACIVDVPPAVAEPPRRHQRGGSEELLARSQPTMGQPGRCQTLEERRT